MRRGTSFGVPTGIPSPPTRALFGADCRGHPPPTPGSDGARVNVGPEAPAIPTSGGERPQIANICRSRCFGQNRMVSSDFSRPDGSELRAGRSFVGHSALLRPRPERRRRQRGRSRRLTRQRHSCPILIAGVTIELRDRGRDAGWERPRGAAGQDLCDQSRGLSHLTMLARRPGSADGAPGAARARATAGLAHPTAPAGCRLRVVRRDRARGALVWRRSDLWTR
jgi:hypothetical protein